MSMTDPIADMLTRIRNAAKAQHRMVDIPSSNVKKDIARILHELGFIREYSETKDSKQGILRVYLQYAKGDMKKLGYQVGTTVISTSRGIMTHEDALKAGVGGEALLRVW